MKMARDPAVLRAAQEVRDLTTRELALLVGVDEKTVRLALDGGRITPERARRLARVLRRGVHELFVTASTAEQADECTAVPA